MRTRPFIYLPGSKESKRCFNKLNFNPEPLEIGSIQFLAAQSRLLLSCNCNFLARRFCSSARSLKHRGGGCDATIHLTPITTMKVIDAIRNIYNPKRSHAGIWCDLPPSSFDSACRREGTQLQLRRKLPHGEEPRALKTIRPSSLSWSPSNLSPLRQL